MAWIELNVSICLILLCLVKSLLNLLSEEETLNGIPDCWNKLYPWKIVNKMKQTRNKKKYLLRDQSYLNNRGKQNKWEKNRKVRKSVTLGLGRTGRQVNKVFDVSLPGTAPQRSKFPIIFNLLKRTNYLHNILSDGRDRKIRQLFSAKYYKVLFWNVYQIVSHKSSILIKR